MVEIIAEEPNETDVRKRRKGKHVTKSMSRDKIIKPPTRQSDQTKAIGSGVDDGSKSIE